MENDVLYNRIMNVVHEEYGEGSTAVANPEGEPTDDLTSIQIGDDVYSISGGGGTGNGVLVATASTPSGYDGQILNKTYAEIKEALSAKTPAFIYDYIEETIEDGVTIYTIHLQPITVVEKTYLDGEYTYGVYTDATYEFFADSEDGVLYNGSTPQA